jgi:hypothetical protein
MIIGVHELCYYCLRVPLYIMYHDRGDGNCKRDGNGLSVMWCHPLADGYCGRGCTAESAESSRLAGILELYPLNPRYYAVYSNNHTTMVINDKLQLFEDTYTAQQRRLTNCLYNAADALDFGTAAMLGKGCAHKESILLRVASHVAHR